MVNIIKTLKKSPFRNTYGGLDLVIGYNGERYLEMEDCSGTDTFGPLTEEEVEAFNILCKVEEV